MSEQQETYVVGGEQPEPEREPEPEPIETKRKRKKGEPEPMGELIFEDGTAIAASGCGIHLIQDGKRRWVPDTFTQTRLGIRMDYVVMLFPEQLLSIPEGKPMPSQAPAEPLF